jgi:hypothetical protein
MVRFCMGVVVEGGRCRWEENVYRLESSFHEVGA